MIDIDKKFARRYEDKRPPVVRIIAAPPRAFYARPVPIDMGGPDTEPPVRNGPDTDCPICESEKARKLPLTREVLHVNARRRIPGPMIDVPMVAPRHKPKCWMTDSYHKRIQKKWDKQVKGKTTKVYPTEPVILSLSKVAVDKIARATRLTRAGAVRAATEDLTIPHEGKFPPLRVTVDSKNENVVFRTREQEIKATAEDLNAAEWVTLHLKPGGRHA